MPWFFPSHRWPVPAWQCTRRHTHPYKCQMVMQHMSRNLQWSYPINYSHTSPPQNGYKCNNCPWKFTLASELTIHCRGTHDTRRHTCLWCPRYFINQQELVKHSNEHHHFSCSFCNDIFPSQIELVAHQAVKHGRLVWEEQEHQEEQASEEIPHFTCNHCTNSFSSQKGLDNHTIKFHTYIYGKCYKVFRDNTELDFHMDMIHNLTPRSLPAKYPDDNA